MDNSQIAQADSDDDYEFVGTLPTRPKATGPQLSQSDVKIDLHTTGIPRQLLLSITPPKSPVGDLKHTPCDIVLVIDVSGSMETAAELPDQHDQQRKEQSGLSILDLVKHASRTILEKLDARDRLAIVTFSTNACVVQGLLPMNDEQKVKTARRIEELETQDCTNLWAGVRDGLEVLEGTEQTGNVQGMFVLTDGAPNHMSPSQGYVKKLQPILQRMRHANGTVPTICTFGFGYTMKSALLRSIAEVGQGYYAFIPDAGMIGTVFVHAVAVLFSTYATNAELVIHWADTRNPIRVPSYLGMHHVPQASEAPTTVISIGNLLYGHSRNIVLETALATGKLVQGATIKYHKPGNGKVETMQIDSCQITPTYSASSVAYHVSRHELCDFLSSLCAKDINNEYTSLLSSSIPPVIPLLQKLTRTFEERLSKLQAQNLNTADLQALIADIMISGPESVYGTGQISLALQTNVSCSGCQAIATPTTARFIRDNRSYYSRWGMHYLPAILHSHLYQITTTFRDPGPQRYSINSPLFVKFRDELDEAFDLLPAPKPSLVTQTPGLGYQDMIAGTKTADMISRLNMKRFNSVQNPCFRGNCVVRMANAKRQRFMDCTKWDLVENVRPGQKVWTPTGPRAVKEVVRTEIEEQEMCIIGKLVVTPWHPVRWKGKWIFPDELCTQGLGEKCIFRGDAVYSFMLEKDANDEAHIVDVGGVKVTTLGHGLTEINVDDVRSHSFFGNHALLQESLSKLDVDASGRRRCGGIARVRQEIGEIPNVFLRPEQARKTRLCATSASSEVVMFKSNGALSHLPYQNR